MNTTLLDIGGTFIKCSDGRVIPINSAGPREAIAASLRQAVMGADRLGIAIPGPFDYREGIFRADHKFAAVQGLSFRELAGLGPEVDVRFIHDVGAVLEGAVRMLHLRSGNTALVTLGTGLGFAIARKGVVRYNPAGSPADCIWNLPCEGGILEDKVSGRGVRAIYSSLGGPSDCTARDIAENAFHGDRTAFEAYERMGAILGSAIRSNLVCNDVDTLLFGGQVSQSLDLMEDGLRSALGPDITIARAPEKAVFKGIETLFNI